MPRSTPGSTVSIQHVPAALPLLKGVTLTLGRNLLQWQQRRRSRAALGRLDRHLLQDIGLSDSHRQEECHKSFWQA